MAAERFALAVGLLIGVVVRAAPVIGAGSVVGDGGLWMAMIEDIRAAGLQVPASTSYNGLDIPFVYPPGALLGAAALGEAFGLATLDLLRWAPLALSILGLGAFAWLAHRTLNPGAAAAATLAYGLMPSAYGWLVAGGGLTRAAGLAFALLAAGLVVTKPGRRPTWRTAAGAGALIGLSALCHPQTAIFGVVACAVLSWSEPRREWLSRVGVAALVAFVVALPWVAGLLANGGTDAVVGAGGRFEPVVGIIRMVNLRFSAAPFMDVVAIAAVTGLVMSIARRRFKIPILLVAVYLAGVGGGEFLAAPVWALLAGSGVMSIRFLMRRSLEGASRPLAGGVIAGTALAALFLALIGSMGSTTDESSKLHPLTPDHVAAMTWLRDNSEPGVEVVVPSDEVWGFDDIGEWLPAIAERHGVGTVQGSEWLGRDAFTRQLVRHRDIRACAGATAECYRELHPEAVVFVPKGQLNGLFSPADCCPALRSTLEEAGYSILYDGPGATIAAP